MSGLFLDRVYRMMVEAADAAAPCPTNRTIADALGMMSDAGASQAVQQLARLGRIRVERGHQARVVEIVATGARTRPSKHQPSPESAVDEGGYRGPVPEHLRVQRDACPRCGVRRDIGCEHRPARLAVEFGL